MFRKCALSGCQYGWLQLPAIKGTVVRKRNLAADSVYYFRVLPNFEESDIVGRASDGWALSPPSEAVAVCRLPLSTRNLLGPNLVDCSRREVSVDSLAGYTIGIYASASWCGPCRQYTPSLATFYKEARASGRKFEVVFVSCDRDEASSDAYFSKMPWLAVPYSSPAREAALQHLQVRSPAGQPSGPRAARGRRGVTRGGGAGAGHPAAGDCRAGRADGAGQRRADAAEPRAARRVGPGYRRRRRAGGAWGWLLRRRVP